VSSTNDANAGLRAEHVDSFQVDAAWNKAQRNLYVFMFYITAVWKEREGFLESGW
jgi:hypothetical protein